MALPQFEDSSLKGSSEIAKTLGVLRAKRSSFTPEQLSAYTNLQNAVMGLPTEKTADAYIKDLAGLLETTPESTVPETAPVAANENSGETEAAVAPVEVPVPEVETAPGLRFIERDRIGISFGVSNPEVRAETPAPVALHENAPEAVVPPPEQTESVVEPAAPVEAPVLTPATEASVVESPEPAQGLKEIERPSDIEAVAKEVGTINEALNVFAHGRAFQWLRNPDTGYREYMTKLIAIREAINGARKGKGGGDLKAMVDELRTLGENVRRAVGDETASQKQSATQNPVETAAASEEQTVPETVPSSAVIAPEEVPLPPEAPLSQETSAPVAEVPNETVIPIKTSASVMPEATSAEPLNIYEQPRVDTAVPQVEAQTKSSPIVEVPQEISVQAQMSAEEDGGRLGFSADTSAENVPEAIESKIQAPITPDAPLPNPEIYSPQVKGALNDLLTEWLGHTGWIVRKNGLDHPSWHKMAPLTVGQVLAAGKDGQAIAGLDFATIDNLAQNLTKWGQLYSISMLQHEDTTIDEIMHRIVFESLKQ